MTNVLTIEPEHSAGIKQQSGAGTFVDSTSSRVSPIDSKVADIRKADSSEGVSSLPFLINLSTRVARLVTTFTSGVVPEPLLIINSVIQMTANACVIAVIQLYRNQKAKKI